MRTDEVEHYLDAEALGTRMHARSVRREARFLHLKSRLMQLSDEEFDQAIRFLEALGDKKEQEIKSPRHRELPSSELKHLYESGRGVAEAISKIDKI